MSKILPTLYLHSYFKYYIIINVNIIEIDEIVYLVTAYCVVTDTVKNKSH